MDRDTEGIGLLHLLHVKQGASVQSVRPVRQRRSQNRGTLKIVFSLWRIFLISFYKISILFTIRITESR